MEHTYSIEHISVSTVRGFTIFKKVTDKPYYTNNHSCFLLSAHLVLVTKYHHLWNEWWTRPYTYSVWLFTRYKIDGADQQDEVKNCKTCKTWLSDRGRWILLETCVLDKQLFCRLCRYKHCRNRTRVHQRTVTLNSPPTYEVGVLFWWLIEKLPFEGSFFLSKKRTSEASDVQKMTSNIVPP